MRILADAAKVDGAATLGEEEETVEALEEHSGRLVDSTKDGLAGILEPFKKVKNGPGGLGVETRGGFVEEEE